VRAGAGSVRDGAGSVRAAGSKAWQAVAGCRRWPRCVAARHGGHNSCVPRVGWQRWVLSTVVHAAAPAGRACRRVHAHPLPATSRRAGPAARRAGSHERKQLLFQQSNSGGSHSPGRIPLNYGARCWADSPKRSWWPAWQDKAFTYLMKYFPRSPWCRHWSCDRMSGELPGHPAPSGTRTRPARTAQALLHGLSQPLGRQVELRDNPPPWARAQPCSPPCCLRWCASVLCAHPASLRPPPPDSCVPLGHYGCCRRPLPAAAGLAGCRCSCRHHW
jgi:hypothetical protein